MGSYYGVRSPSGELIAMGGERLQLDGYSEISAVCTHPSHRCDGLVSWLHVQILSRNGVPAGPQSHATLHTRKTL